jgi:hypothetical protein
MHSRLYPHRHPHPLADQQHNHEGHGIHPTLPDAVTGVGVRTGNYQHWKVEEMEISKGIQWGAPESECWGEHYFFPTYRYTCTCAC